MFSSSGIKSSLSPQPVGPVCTKALFSQVQKDTKSRRKSSLCHREKRPTLTLWHLCYKVAGKPSLSQYIEHKNTPFLSVVDASPEQRCEHKGQWAASLFHNTRPSSHDTTAANIVIVLSYLYIGVNHGSVASFGAFKKINASSKGGKHVTLKRVSGSKSYIQTICGRKPVWKTREKNWNSN